MSPAKPVSKSFEAVLERTADGLRWVIVRIPFDAAKLWGKRGQLRVQGEINGFPFKAILFPAGDGRHFMIVNKKLQSGGKTGPGLAARFILQPDATPRVAARPPKELLRELGQSKRVLKFYEALSPSRRNDIAKWVSQTKTSAARQRRSQQITERLMETMEAERDLPPMIQLALRQNPKALAVWKEMSPAHRRTHLFSIFYYRDPEARARRIGRCMEELLDRTEKTKARRATG